MIFGGLTTMAALPPHIRRLQAMAEAILPAGVAVVCSGATGDVGRLFPAERTFIARAIPARQAEFAAGRIAARAALLALGQPAQAIPVGLDRSPVWPNGFTGSISHCRTAAMAIATPLAGPTGHVGIDVEDAAELDRDLWESICTPGEIAMLQAYPDAGRRAKAIFSIKEAVYKAQYPVTGNMLDFQQVELDAIDPAGSFTARIAAGPIKSVSGHFQASDQLVLAYASTGEIS